MRVDSAIHLIQSLVYRPGWLFLAESAESRFESGVKVIIEYPAQETSRDEAKRGYVQANRPYASFILLVADCDDVDLYRQLMQRVLEIESHEAREYFRVKPTYWAPFHPHQIDGMKRWGNPESDLTFGSA